MNCCLVLFQKSTTAQNIPLRSLCDLPALLQSLVCTKKPTCAFAFVSPFLCFPCPLSPPSSPSLYSLFPTPLCLYQFLSILINSYKSLSVLVNFYPSSSVLVRSCQFLSVLIRSYPFLSILIRSDPF